MQRRGDLLRSFVVMVVISALAAAQEPDQEQGRRAAEKFAQARAELRGAERDTEAAHRILTQLVKTHADDLSPTDLCYAYVYLGYLEDRDGNREAAIGWFQKAVPLDGPKIEGIRRVAELGLDRPITWLRHLDKNTGRQLPKRRQPRVIETIGEATVSLDPPAVMPTLKMDLSQSEMMENFDSLWQGIDRYYSFFVHKKIDWNAVKREYQPRIRSAKDAEEFYHLVYLMVRELKDNHSRLYNYQDPTRLPRFTPAVAIRHIEGKAVVTRVSDEIFAKEKDLVPGSVITTVDGIEAAERVEQLREALPVSSSKRNLLETAYRSLLYGKEASVVEVGVLAPGSDKAIQLKLERDSRGVPDERVVGFPHEEDGFIWSGVHPSGCGYIRILSFKARSELADAFDRALEKLKDTRGLVIDIRGNPGGYGTAQPRMIGRLINRKTTAGLVFVKSGSAHDEFTRREMELEPQGDWQYEKPVALLIDSITGSASDLFACHFIGTGRPIVVGTPSHGNSTGTAVYVQLSCGLAVRVSRGYTATKEGQIIETRGNVPDIHAALTIDDIISQTDSVITRAVEAMED